MPGWVCGSGRNGSISPITSVWAWGGNRRGQLGTDGRPLEAQDSLAAADRHQFRYEVEMR